MGPGDLNIEGILAVIDGTLRDFVISNNLDNILAILCGMAVTFQMSKVVITNLLRGGEGFSFSVLGPPIFSIIMIAAWPTLSNFILDASNGIAYTVVEKQSKVTKNNQESYQKIDKMIYEIERKNKEINQSIATEESVMDFGFESLGNDIKAFSDKIGLRIAKMCLTVCTVLDAFIYASFYFIGKLWLKFVLFGGSIAFTISVLTGGWTNLINWAKTVVNVSLWLPVAGIMMQLINTIMINVFEGLNSQIDDIAGDMSNGMTALTLSVKFLDTLLILLGVTIIFIGLKILMLAKVPAIISTWISGGGGGASGGFAMGFIPTAMAGAALKSTMGSVVSGSSKSISSFKK